MKKVLALVLALSLVLSLAACSGDEGTAGSVSTSKEEVAEPVDPAWLDSKLSTGVKLANALLDATYDKIEEYGDGTITAGELENSCNRSANTARGFIDEIAALKADGISGAYIDAAHAAVQNVWSTHFNLKEFLAKGGQENFDKLSAGMNSQPEYTTDVETARRTYLAENGFSEEEIAEMVEKSPLVRPEE